MSSVWLTIPSARPVPEAQACVDAWRAQGYRVALWRDAEDAVDCDLKLVGQYPGYARACNALIHELLEREPEARWFICAGDDILPDPTKRADEIARECEEHFRGTYGVCQPTADGHGIETICGSAWIGREFCERTYGGRGPLHAGYFHNFVDNELQEIAKILGVFWQRPDLRHEHRNWMWTTGKRPAFLDRAYSQAEWNSSMNLFTNRRAAGFPGHEVASGQR